MQKLLPWDSPEHVCTTFAFEKSNFHHVSLPTNSQPDTFNAKGLGWNRFLSAESRAWSFLWSSYSFVIRTTIIIIIMITTYYHYYYFHHWYTSSRALQAHPPSPDEDQHQDTQPNRLGGEEGALTEQPEALRECDKGPCPCPKKARTGAVTCPCWTDCIYREPPLPECAHRWDRNTGMKDKLK